MGLRVTANMESKSRDLFAADLGAIQGEADALWRQYRAYRAHRRGPLHAQRRLSDRSAATYEDIWSAFALYCAKSGLDPRLITVEQLRDFLAHRRPRGGHLYGKLATRHARRILWLIDQVLTVDAALRGGDRNGAAAQLLLEAPYRDAEKERRSAPILRTAEVAAVRDCCLLPLGEQGAGAPESWKDLRDSTLVMLSLETGAAPADLRALRASDVQRDRRGRPQQLSLPPRRYSGPREVRIADSDAAVLLGRWMAMRLQMGFKERDWLFPATASGRQMSERLVALAVRQTLDRAGIEMPAATGAMLLRNTYIARALLLEGQPAAAVAARVGIRDPEKMLDRFRGIEMF